MENSQMKLNLDLKNITPESEEAMEDEEAL